MNALVLSKTELKRNVLQECLRMQNELVEVAKNFMEQANECANEHEIGGDDKMESFREQCHMDRDMYAIKYRDAMNNLVALKKTNPDLEWKEVKIGSIVITAQQKLFISVGLGQINVDKESFVVISTQSPLYQSIQGKKAGDKFNFRGKDIQILDVF